MMADHIFSMQIDNATESGFKGSEQAPKREKDIALRKLSLINIFLLNSSIRSGSNFTLDSFPGQDLPLSYIT